MVWMWQWGREVRGWTWASCAENRLCPEAGLCPGPLEGFRRKWHEAPVCVHGLQCISSCVAGDGAQEWLNLLAAPHCTRNGCSYLLLHPRTWSLTLKLACAHFIPGKGHHKYFGVHLSWLSVLSGLLVAISCLYASVGPQNWSPFCWAGCVCSGRTRLKSEGRDAQSSQRALWPSLASNYLVNAEVTIMKGFI